MKTQGQCFPVLLVEITKNTIYGWIPSESFSFTYTENGKPAADSSWEFFKIENEQMKTAQHNSYG